MKKKIEDLTDKDVIHCPTREEWIEIRSIDPSDSLNDKIWDDYKQETCYRPTGGGRSNFGHLDFYKKHGCTIHKAEDFLENSKGYLYLEGEDKWIELGSKYNLSKLPNLENKINKKIKKLKKSIANQKRQLEFLESLIK